MLFISLLRTSIYHGVFFLILPICFILLTLPAFSQEDSPTPPPTDDALEEELKYLKAETYVITASRIPENIKKTASSVTVMTDKEIRQMGARNLADVIQTVPGMGYWYHYAGTHVGYAGGISHLFSAKILIMVNSHPLNENYLGGAMITHDTMALDNVKRIEFIKGPGSALYGANAFAGVINIITKEAEDIDGWELTAAGGSYDTQQYNLLYGKTLNDLEIAFNFNYYNTHGFDGHVNKDLQTLIDRWRIINASLAPGRMKGDDEKYDASLNLKYKGFTFDGRYVDRWDRKLAVGLVPVLNNNTLSIKDYYLNLSYERNLWGKLDFLGKVYRNHNHLRAYYQYFPPGSALFTPLIIPWFFPEGTIAIPSAKNSRTGFETQTTYKMSEFNTFVAGISYEEMKQYDVRTRGNLIGLRDPIPEFIIIPFLRVRDLTDIKNFSRSVKRNFKAFFIEDIWDITDDLRLTVGVRYDDYSDFGDSFNPRAGLVWEYVKGYDLKLLYGRAFRAPSFEELYDSLYGNPDLDPEEVDTYQVSLGAEFIPELSGRLTWFRSIIRDAIIQQSISIDPDFKNIGKMHSEGIELEMRYNFGRGTYLAMNYTYLIDKERMTWMIPRQVANIIANIRLSRYFNFYTSCHIEDGFRRSSSRFEKRDDMSGYGIVNTTLIAKKFVEGYENLELRGSIYNLFDKDYTSPADWWELPEDLPRPGRNFIIEVKYKF